MSDPGHWGWCASFRGGPCNCVTAGMSTPAENAATVRERLLGGPYALAALDALQAQAENGLDESDLEHQSGRRAYWKERAEAAEAEACSLVDEARRATEAMEAAEAERDRLREQLEQLVTAVEAHKPECDRLAARVEELEAANAHATQLLDDLLLSFAADMDSDAMVEKRIEEVCAALATDKEQA